MRALLALVLVLALPSTLDAQKNCTKGIPCGNTCIARDKVCRVGTPAPAPLSSTAPAGKLLDPAYPWVASPRGRTYYANVKSCSGMKQLKSHLFFKSEDEALEKGLVRSRQRGC